MLGVLAVLDGPSGHVYADGHMGNLCGVASAKASVSLQGQGGQEQE